MTSKVFLFGNYSWLYCTNVKYKNSIWTGWVENGAWFLHFDENTNISKACYDAKSVNDPVTTSNDIKLVWACDINEKLRGYNEIIEDAKIRYENGEPSNLLLVDKKKPVDKEYELYLKLRDKYKPDDIAF